MTRLPFLRFLPPEVPKFTKFAITSSFLKIFSYINIQIELQVLENIAYYF